MLKLEDIQTDLTVTGLDASSICTIAAIVPIGEGSIQVFYRTPDGNTKERLLGRADEPNLCAAIVEGQSSFDDDGEASQLACEANRIDLACLFESDAVEQTTEGRIVSARINSREVCLTRFGFSFERGGAHLARSMMLDELRKLLEYKPEQSATRDDYQNSIVVENCLGKRSLRTRQLTLRHLRSLYGLDPCVPIFRAMRFFWQRDSETQSLLAFLIAYSRDSVLRSSAPFVLRLPVGATLVCGDLEEFLEQSEEGRFSKETLKAASQRILASWAHAGHLIGRVQKTRSIASATPGSVAVALFLGYITGARGQTLFETEYTRLLDCSKDHAIELAETASRRGWIVCKRIGSVIEVLFPNLLTAQELEWVREQS